MTDVEHHAKCPLYVPECCGTCRVIAKAAAAGKECSCPEPDEEVRRGACHACQGRGERFYGYGVDECRVCGGDGLEPVDGEATP